MKFFNLSRVAKVALISSVYKCRKPSGGTHSPQRLVIHLVDEFAVTSRYLLVSTTTFRYFKLQI